MPRRGPLYTDSDIYKWMEAVAFALESNPAPELEAKLDGLIADVLAAQEPSGYLNTWYVDGRRKLRFTEQQRGTSFTAWVTCSRRVSCTFAGAGREYCSTAA